MKSCLKRRGLSYTHGLGLDMDKMIQIYKKRIRFYELQYNLLLKNYNKLRSFACYKHCNNREGNIIRVKS